MDRQVLTEHLGMGEEGKLADKLLRPGLFYLFKLFLIPAQLREI